jgi:hypothetical protein
MAASRYGTHDRQSRDEACSAKTVQSRLFGLQSGFSSVRYSVLSWLDGTLRSASRWKRYRRLTFRRSHPLHRI